MLRSCDVIAFLATKNPEAARAFYEDVLGLRFVSDDGFALVFDAGGTTLRIVKLKDVQPVAYTALGWQVDDIEATVQTLRERGVTMERYEGMEQDELGIWESPGGGARVAWFRDPDGNTLSVTGL